MDVSEFLLARVAEDEAAARGQIELRTARGMGEEVEPGREPYEIQRGWFLYVEPTHVLAECEAKRRIVEAHPLVPASDIWHEPTGGLGCQVCDERADLTCGGFEIERSGGCATLRHLAAVYAGHPDFQPEWALERV